MKNCVLTYTDFFYMHSPHQPKFAQVPSNLSRRAESPFSACRRFSGNSLEHPGRP